jgi:endo-1,4-beta-xylanase
MDRRRLIAGVTAMSALAGIRRASCLPRKASADDSARLKDVMMRCRGGLIGAQASRSVLEKHSALTAFIYDNLSILTPGNDMKWSFLRPSQDTVDFDGRDWFVAYCRANGIAVHGHNLCWNSDNPKWLDSSLTQKNAERVLREHIEVVAHHYQGKVDSWDVVNEPTAPWSNRSDGLREGPWLASLGPDYIEIAFRATAEADPKAIRVLNVNHVEQFDIGVDLARRKVLELLDRLLSREVPVQAVGLESHLDTSKRIDAIGLGHFVRQIKHMGLEVMITEMDVLDNSAPADFRERDAVVAKLYSEYLKIIMEVASPKRLIFWSLSDQGNWYDNWAKLSPNIRRSDDLPHRPGLLDTDMNPKVTLDAVCNSLRCS